MGAADGPLRDQYGREVHYLRLSVTDRCNLRCVYCRSEARQTFIPHPKVLRYEEMVRLVGVLAGLGVRKVRLTGGEPFARKDCDTLLALLAPAVPAAGPAPDYQRHAAGAAHSPAAAGRRARRESFSGQF